MVFKNTRKEYIIIFIILVTEILGFSLILPFLPFYAQELGATPLQIGLILATFSLFQFISAPIMGKLSDSYGRIPLLIFSQLSTLLSFIILGFAGSLWMIYFSRIVDGLLGSNFTIAQAYLSDISSKKDRSKAFGISGAAFGFAFLIGPAVGGYLAQFNYSLPSFIAAGLSLLTIFMTFFFLPETIKNKKPKKIKITKLFDIEPFIKYFSQQKVSLKLWQVSSFFTSHVIWVSVFALYADKQLNIGTKEVGFILAYAGLMSIILRGVLLGKIIDFFGEKKLKFAGYLSVIIGLLLAVFIKNFWLFFAVMTLFSFGFGILRPLLLGSISREISENEQGSIIGLTSSLGSLTQIFGPLIGGLLINYFFPGSVAIVAGAVMIIGLILFLVEIKSSKAKI